MDVPSEVIYSAFTAIGVAIVALWHQTRASHQRCEERAAKGDTERAALSSEISTVRGQMTNMAMGVIRENITTSNAILKYLKEIRRDVRELDPSDQKSEQNQKSDSDTHPVMTTGNYDRVVLETNDSGETTAIIRKRSP